MPIHALRCPIASLLLAAGAFLGAQAVTAQAPAAPPARIKLSDLKFYTPDQDFKPIEPAPWVYDGVQKVFLF